MKCWSSKTKMNLFWITPIQILILNSALNFMIAYTPIPPMITRGGYFNYCLSRNKHFQKKIVLINKIPWIDILSGVVVANLIILKTKNLENI